MMYLILSSFYSYVSTSEGAGTALSLNYVNKCFLCATYSTLFEGIPITSIINCNYSLSFVPGNNGNPVNNSIMMHPMLHMSIP
jgi:hypothetical protein